MPIHVEQAQASAAAQPEAPLASATVGDARHLAFPDGSADAAILLGPMYHLTERAERVAALREAARVVRPGGIVAAAVISRFASTLDGFKQGLMGDAQFVAIAQQDLRDGQHRNPTNNPGYFTTTYFHRPDEPEAEMTDAGLHHISTLAIEGPLWTFPWTREQWNDPTNQETMLSLLRTIESEPTLLGASSHLLAIGRV
jgi:SAM-dependent methyltransferase